MTTTQPPFSPANRNTVSDADLILLQQQVEHLQVAVEHELRAAGPMGLNELQLIRALQGARWRLIGPVNFKQPARLYPVHFLLFHALYRLQDQLLGAGESVIITPMQLSIIRKPGKSGQPLPAERDTLRTFYLDVSRYFMSGADIRDMMDNFLAGLPVHKPDSTEAVCAARALGFDALPDQFATVKQRFRKRVMQAHPDRGGDTEAIQELNQAFSILKAHYA